MKDFSGTALIMAAIGFFMVLGAAGSSDCGKPLAECLLWAAAGVLMIVAPFVCMYLYERFVTDAE